MIETQQEIRLFCMLPLKKSSLARSLISMSILLFKESAISYFLVFSSRKTSVFLRNSQSRRNQKGDGGKRIFDNLNFLGNTTILGINDEFCIQDERMAINRRLSSMQTRLRQKYSRLLQAASIQVTRLISFISYRVEQRDDIPRKISKERVL